MEAGLEGASAVTDCGRSQGLVVLEVSSLKLCQHLSLGWPGFRLDINVNMFIKG